MPPEPEPQADLLKKGLYIAGNILAALWIAAATTFFLVRFSTACGGWSNVATVLFELAERLEPKALCALAGHRKTPEVQRLGYLLDRAGQPRLADPLLRTLGSRRYRPVGLAPDAPSAGVAAATPWRVVPNAEAEIDL